VTSVGVTSSGIGDIPIGEPWPTGREPGPFDDVTVPEPPDPTDREARKDNEKPKAGPPSLDQWQDFFARVVIKGVTERYIDFVFRGIDENELTERELARLYLSPEERERIARPFSELANKLKVTRKHGRTIIASADSVDSVLALAMWFGRVNRIAARHSKPQVKVVQSDVSSSPFEANGTAGETNGFAGYGTSYQPWPESPGTG
jgi:hypothetical protein